MQRNERIIRNSTFDKNFFVSYGPTLPSRILMFLYSLKDFANGILPVILLQQGNFLVLYELTVGVNRRLTAETFYEPYPAARERAAR